MTNVQEMAVILNVVGFVVIMVVNGVVTITIVRVVSVKRRDKENVNVLKLGVLKLNSALPFLAEPVRGSIILGSARTEPREQEPVVLLWSVRWWGRIARR